MRRADASRKTKETQIELSLDLDGTGKAQIDTGVGFFDHMLELFTVHGRLNVTLSCRGDLQVDAHHTVEDVGIALGDCFRQALGDKKGIARFADRLVPMDDVAALVAVDFSGRPALIFEETLSGRVGNFDMELVEECLRAFTAHAGFNLYVKLLRCGNRHHEAEAIFKALALCVRDAVKIVSDEIPSSKGMLE